MQKTPYNYSQKPNLMWLEVLVGLVYIVPLECDLLPHWACSKPNPTDQALEVLGPSPVQENLVAQQHCYIESFFL